MSKRFMESIVSRKAQEAPTVKAKTMNILPLGGA